MEASRYRLQGPQAIPLHTLSQHSTQQRLLLTNLKTYGLLPYSLDT